MNRTNLECFCFNCRENHQQENEQTPGSRFEPTTLLLWCNSNNHWGILLPLLYCRLIKDSWGQHKQKVYKGCRKFVMVMDTVWVFFHSPSETETPHSVTGGRGNGIQSKRSSLCGTETTPSVTAQLFVVRLHEDVITWTQPMLPYWSELIIGIPAGWHRVMKVQTRLNADALLIHPPLINCSFQSPLVSADSSPVRHATVFLPLWCPDKVSRRCSITVEMVSGGNITNRHAPDRNTQPSWLSFQTFQIIN